MMLFWIITAAMILVALALLAPSLLRNRQSNTLDRDQQNVVIARERLVELESERDRGSLSQEQFEQARNELERSLLQDLDQTVEEHAVAAPSGKWGRMAMIVVALFVPALTLGLYTFLGTPELVAPRNPALSSAHGEQGLPSVEQMMGKLVERLKQNPDDSEGWYLLGRTSMALKDYAGAATAFQNVHKLVGDEPAVLLAWADALAMHAQGNMLGKPAELIRKAVQLVPQDTTALWLAGMVEEQHENFPLAISYWERLAPLIADDAQASERIALLISRARERVRLDSPGVTAVATATSVEQSAAPARGVSVRVALAPELSERVTPDDTVFIYARALQGPKMPLAAARHQVKELPLELVLDDSGAMLPNMKISNFEQVLVGARVSRAGGPIPQSGDLQGEVAPVNVTAQTVVDIVINKIVP